MNATILKNNFAEIHLTDTGCVQHFFDLQSGKDLLSNVGSPFCSIVTEEGKCYVPDNLTQKDDVLRFFFKKETLHTADNAAIYIRVETEEDYFVFTVLGAPAIDFHCLRLFEMQFVYDFDVTDTIVPVCIPMTLNINPVSYPGVAAKAVGGVCYSKIGMRNAKMAIITGTREAQREIIKRVQANIPAGTMPFLPTCGANALDCKDNYKNYAIVSTFDLGELDDYIHFLKEVGIEQLAFHQGGFFRQGDFQFTLTDGVRGFREQVTEPLARAGIQSCIHTYSPLINYEADGILSCPKWQKDLDVFHRFTLAKNISEEDTEIVPIESLTDIRGMKSGGTASSSTIQSDYLLIGEEIIQVNWEEDRFVKCIRGWAKTKPSQHDAGDEIKVLSKKYNNLVPVPNTELFFHIARETARAYNEGGFSMIYLDAFESIYAQTAQAGKREMDYAWYYSAAFVTEILKNCIKTPVIEYSSMGPYLWGARGRGFAWDSGMRAYRTLVHSHVMENQQKVTNMFYVGNIGWLSFYWISVDPNYPQTFMHKYMFLDDVDYIATQALLNNYFISYTGLSHQDYKNFPGMQRNMKRYVQYDNIRRAKIVPEDILNEMRNSAYEWKLSGTETNPVFSEMCYLRQKMHTLADERRFVSSVNPFGKQKPFIRIENLLTSAGEEPEVLLPLDPDVPLRDQPLYASYEPKQLNEKLAMRVRVLGNNSDDAICIRPDGLTDDVSGSFDFVIPLNFTGWREYILADIDNGDYPDLVFEGRPKPERYKYHMAPVDYNRLTETSVFLSGNCEGVRMGPIEAVKHCTRDLVNPTVKIGDEQITFHCTLSHPEYLEYTPDGQALVYDLWGNSREVQYSGAVTVPNGTFTAELTECECATAPGRAVLTLGVAGRKLSC